VRHNLSRAVGAMMRVMIMIIEQTCSHCNGARVFIDALARWSTVKQEWVLHQVYDHLYCRDCDTECDITERNISNE
jgi:hypothetical protein